MIVSGGIIRTWLERGNVTRHRGGEAIESRLKAINFEVAATIDRHVFCPGANQRRRSDSSARKRLARGIDDASGDGARWRFARLDGAGLLPPAVQLKHEDDRNQRKTSLRLFSGHHGPPGIGRTSTTNVTSDSAPLETSTTCGGIRGRGVGVRILGCTEHSCLPGDRFLIRKCPRASAIAPAGSRAPSRLQLT